MPLFDKLSDKFGELMKDKFGGGTSFDLCKHRPRIDLSQTKNKAVTALTVGRILNTINSVDNTSSNLLRMKSNSRRTTEDNNCTINISEVKTSADHEIRYGVGPPGQLPPGWIQQWEANSQRYYFVEQATGRTQWEPPVMYPGGGIHGPPQGYGHQGYGQEGYRGHGGEGYHGPPYAEHEKKKDSSHTGVALAGGALLGAGAGAWAMHEYSELADAC